MIFINKKCVIFYREYYNLEYYNNIDILRNEETNYIIKKLYKGNIKFLI